MNLQHHMDEQQEKHERLMVGRDWAEGLADKCRDRIELNAKLDNPFKSMKSYKSIDVYENVPGRGTIFMVNIHPDEQLPKNGEKILIDGQEHRLRYCEVGVGLFGRGKCVGLVVFPPIPAPQEPSDGSGGTKTPLEEIEALKPKESGFRPKQGSPRCYDPSHNPPMHLYIPPDQEYVHVCPSCRATVVIQGPEIMW